MDRFGLSCHVSQALAGRCKPRAAQRAHTLLDMKVVQVVLGSTNLCALNTGSSRVQPSTAVQQPAPCVYAVLRLQTWRTLLTLITCHMHRPFTRQIFN
jgi:endonuclease YncB( thermonuclease family)